MHPRGVGPPLRLLLAQGGDFRQGYPRSRMGFSRRHNMGTRASELTDRLSRYRQIKISVIGRKSGRTISIPVWFVLEGNKLYLLPVQGSATQWYRNVLQNPSIRVDARGAEAEFRAAPLTSAKAVSSVVEKFREKYGARDVKKYYSKFDVAVLIELDPSLRAYARRGAGSGGPQAKT